MTVLRGLLSYLIDCYILTSSMVYFCGYDLVYAVTEGYGFSWPMVCKYKQTLSQHKLAIIVPTLSISLNGGTWSHL